MVWRNILDRLQSLGFAVFILVVVAGGVLLFVPIWAKRHTMNNEIRRLDAEVAQREALEKKQKAEIEALKTDPSYVERTARDKLNLAKPNEMVFRFESNNVSTGRVVAPR
jgi:cell division protein FtsB